MINISIVITTYNELNNIKNYFDELYNLLLDNNKLELILIDRNSQDRIIDVLKDYYPKVIIKENFNNISKSEAFDQALYICSYDKLIFLDSCISFGKNQLMNFFNNDFRDFTICNYGAKTVYKYKYRVFY